ncbi:multiple epidermal growth factor-like domains protein 10 [Gigantopelta aegis]|uniref:multiple epidermal growth factor-like domains protein 10 n=1 Tax=Gigantopelta aegis TaxID=1735272 RepID=UPI001B88DBDE|nr:multiple epidermal growth factor-like domains protein 10 [Gigantopelta aegis]
MSKECRYIYYWFLLAFSTKASWPDKPAQHCSYCAESCFVCMPGYYGQHCDKECSSCNKEEICDRQNGTCVKRDVAISIESGWAYNCMLCNGECKSCFSGWYKINCTLECNNCDKDGCERLSGVCYNCAGGYCGTHCTERCPENCTDNGVCDRDSKVCLDGCKKGWWGDHCHIPCSEGCLQQECTFDGKECKHGCREGYYGGMCNHRNCSRRCQHCDVNYNCLECVNMFYGEKCSKRCNDGCKNGVCSRDGSCVCRDGYVGNDCFLKVQNTDYYMTTVRHSESCNCVPCNGQCSVCRPGWYGDECKHLCTNCNKDGCEKQTGICHKCKDGYYGYRCILCPENCSRIQNEPYCHPETGMCLHGCTPGWFGVYCNSTCSLGCLNRECNTAGTQCLNGCVDGRYGRLCNNTCSSYCMKQICHNDGTCLQGCKSGFSGEHCLERTRTQTDYISKMDLLIGGLSSLVIFIVIAIVVVCCLRRKRSKAMDGVEVREPTRHETASQHHDEQIDDIRSLRSESASSDHYDYIDDNDLHSISDSTAENIRTSPSAQYLHPQIERDDFNILVDQNEQCSLDIHRVYSSAYLHPVLEQCDHIDNVSICNHAEDFPNGNHCFQSTV